MTSLSTGQMLGRALRLSSLLSLVAVAACTGSADKKPDVAQLNQGRDTAVDGQVEPGLGSPSVPDRVFFAYDSAIISPEARAILERWAAYAKTHPQMIFTVEGHCDERGTREYNLALGSKRAETARAAWVALGMDPGRLRIVSYGKERPAVTGETEAAWAQNRRAVAVAN